MATEKKNDKERSVEERLKALYQLQTLNSGPSEEQSVLLTSEPSHQPPPQDINSKTIYSEYNYIYMISTYICV